MGKKRANEKWSYGKVARAAKKAEKYISNNDINGEEPYKELVKYNARLARESNKRLRALKKAGRDYYAYDVAQSFTNRMFNTTRYKEKLDSANDMKRQILSMQKFLEYETSTVEGHELVEEKRRIKFKARFPILNGEDDKVIDDFLKFLGNSPLRTTIFEEGKEASGGLVDIIRGRYFASNEAGRKEIIKMFENYQEKLGEDTLTGEHKRVLYYDELIEYLNTGKKPDDLKLDEKDKK